jgi:toxin ParE1/3/4
MSLPAILLPLAEADVVEIFGDLEFMRAGVGKRFLSRLREVLERIEGMPEMYGVIWQAKKKRPRGRAGAGANK